MGELTAEPRSAASRRLGEATLPHESPLAMPVQDLSAAPARAVDGGYDLVAIWWRVFVLGGAAVLAALFTREMYAVLSIAGMTLIEMVMLVFFAISIAWIALAFTSAVAGYIVQGWRRGTALEIPDETARPTTRTAILIPTYNEEPARIFAAAAATAEGLAEAGVRDRFDIFVISDTTDPDIWVAEEAAFRAMRLRTPPRTRVYYRRRRKNTERKAGNVAEWVRRFGRTYPAFIVFDADSLMSPATLIALTVAMERNPTAGLIQTVPVTIGRNTFFARLQQFAGRVYGPVIAAGLAAWTGRAGNYWGHNAILRTRAFASHAGLPHLKGKPPFGGHILSHDFVEAALMRRAGWDILLAHSMTGSYEESPPSLVDLAQRDRRWCQGNLQHSKVIGTTGLDWVSRMHFGIGIMSYMASVVWLVFLLAGLMLALQAHFIRPEYFTEDFQLFPTWPVIDFERAIGLFAATMIILFAPKLFGLFLVAVDRKLRHGTGGVIRATASVLLESLIAALMAPIMMAIQTMAIAEILLGRDTGWNPQRRDDGTLSMRDLWRRHRWHTVLGAALGISAWLVSPQLLAWMSPAVIGLLMALPLSALTSSRKVGLTLKRAGLLLIPEEVDEPPILTAARAATADLREATAGPEDGIIRLASDPALLAFHRASLPPPTGLAAGDVDVALAVGLARLETARTLDEAVRYLSAREKLAVLADPDGLERITRLPRMREAAA